ncbi:phage protein [Sulfuriferula multivorans]|uniref:Phage protein n=1 Tax=Sulfuriferula multivorans TaxID=1559896 RepID=A0A401JF19_9PROT|nr:hypothetical protein [Sulfuriferula multivorans]GBL46225.1 phage protein [Sulfuriferula multivorans]
MIADYLAAGALIEAHVRANLPQLDVKAITDIADLDAKTAKDLALFVIYDGDTPAGIAGQNESQLVQQHWLLVLAVRNRRGQATGAGVQDAAGPLLAELIALMLGWRPSAEFTALRRASAPKPGFSASFGYYPLRFETYLITEGA